MNFPGRLFHRAQNHLAFLTHDWRVPALIITFVGHMLIAASTQLLLQYVSKRYELTFSDATFLLTVLNAVRMLLLFIILPYISSLAIRMYSLSGQQKDLYLSRLSQAFIFIGYVLIGLSPNIPTVAVSMAIASLGQGAFLLLRSFLTSLVPAHHIAQVYGMISVVDTLGAMLGSPLLAVLFKRGMMMGGGWIGLPFYFLGFVSAAFLALMLAIGLRKSDCESSDEDGER